MLRDFAGNKSQNFHKCYINFNHLGISKCQHFYKPICPAINAIKFIKQIFSQPDSFKSEISHTLKYLGSASRIIPTAFIAAAAAFILFAFFFTIPYYFLVKFAKFSRRFFPWHLYHLIHVKTIHFSPVSAAFLIDIFELTSET